MRPQYYWQYSFDCLQLANTTLDPETKAVLVDMASYAGFWVTRRSGGVVCRHFDDLDAVLESDTSDDLRQLDLYLSAAARSLMRR